MKPRLQRAPLTDEDLEAWGQVCERFRPASACYWYELTALCDRRDADLMYQRQVLLQARRALGFESWPFSHRWTGLRVEKWTT